MTTSDTTIVLTQRRTVLGLPNTEMQVAETRVTHARTEAVRRELSQNAESRCARIEANETAIRYLGGFPTSVRAIHAYEEAQPNRHGVASAAHTRVAAIAQEVVGIS